jgi:hypothetical protein
MRRKLLVICLAGLASIRVGLSTSATGAIAARASEQTASASWQDRSYRQQSAVTWREGFVRLDRQVPTLSPAEERWLKTEIDDEIANARNRYTKRALAAMDSREYQVRVAKSRLREMVAVLNALTAQKAPIPREEVRLWTELASQFMDKEFWQAVDGLVRLKIVDAKINGVDSLYFENHVLWAKGLLDGFVRPYLQGTLQ